MIRPLDRSHSRTSRIALMASVQPKISWLDEKMSHRR